MTPLAMIACEQDPGMQPEPMTQEAIDAMNIQCTPQMAEDVFGALTPTQQDEVLRLTGELARENAQRHRIAQQIQDDTADLDNLKLQHTECSLRCDELIRQLGRVRHADLR